MIVYLGGRRSGKTTRLLNWWLEDPYNRHIICSTEQRAMHVRHMASELAAHAQIEIGTYFNNIVSTNPRGAKRWEGIQGQKIAIDDLEEVLGVLFQHRIDASAMNIETVHWMEDNS